ncbi:MAG TPA: hypothetical protein VK579_12435 [Terriglobales bacterium]|nr:hypothetical protein [Terriglobales bacterium]
MWCKRCFNNYRRHRSQFSTDRPSVEAGSLKADRRGYVIVVKHSAEPQRVTVTTTMPVRSLSLIAAEGVRLEASSWSMDLEAHEAAVLEWQ